MSTVYFDPSKPNLHPGRVHAEGRTSPVQNMLSLRKRLFNKRKRADRLADLLVELLGRAA
jgi:hypothetical protein